MKRGKTAIPLPPYADAVFCLLTFPLVVSLVYWLTRIACAAAFKGLVR
nr:hypothetical protein [uncultured bacterium]